MRTSHRLTFALTTCAALAMWNCGDPSTVGISGGPPSQAQQPEDGPDSEQMEQTDRATRELPDSPYTRDLEIYENVKPLTDRELAESIQKGPDELILPVGMTETYQVDDVLVSEHNGGIFRVVTGVSERDGQTVLATRPAKLEDAIASGKLYIARLAEDELTAPEAFEQPPTQTQRMGLRQQALGWDGGWHGSLWSYEEDFSSGLNDRIPGDNLQVTRASVSAEIGAEFYADIVARFGWPPVKINEARIMSNGAATGDIRIKLQSDETFEYNERLVLVGDGSRNPLMRVDDIEHTVLPNLFPLKFTFSVSSELDLRASSEGEIDMEVGYKLTAGARAGVVNKDDGWVWVGEQDLVPQRHGPVFSGEKGAEARARLLNKVRLTVGERAHGELELQPATATATFTQLIDADSGQCPTTFDLNARGMISGQLASIDLPILGELDIMGSPTTYELYDEDLIDYDGQLDLPGVCDPDYDPPTNEEQGDQLHGEKCQGTGDCVSGAMCYQQMCVREGELRVSTAWFEDTDLDLFVELPDGQAISYRKTQYGGGQRDFDDCAGEDCPGETERTPAPHVENVFFKDGAPEGDYNVWLIQENGQAATSFEIEVDYQGQTLQFGDMISAEENTSSEPISFRISNGQLEEL